MALRKLIKEFDAYLGEKESILERDFKHVAEKIELHWGYDEFYPFIEKLMVDSRNRRRAGFPIEAAMELTELSYIHEKLYPRKK